MAETEFSTSWVDSWALCDPQELVGDLFLFTPRGVFKRENGEWRRLMRPFRFDMTPPGYKENADGSA